MLQRCNSSKHCPGGSTNRWRWVQTSSAVTNQIIKRTENTGVLPKKQNQIALVNGSSTLPPFITTVSSFKKLIGQMFSPVLRNILKVEKYSVCELTKLNKTFRSNFCLRCLIVEYSYLKRLSIMSGELTITFPPRRTA